MSTIPAFRSLLCFFFVFFARVDCFLKKKTHKSLVFVHMYDLFYICIETNFAEFEKFCGLITFVRKLGDGFTFLFSPDVILCG